MAKRPMTPAQAIRMRRTDLVISRGYWGLLGKTLMLAAVLAVLLTQVFVVTQVSGNGMFPAVKDGDLVVGYRLQGSYAKNDVVVYTQEGARQVGRVIGREGDVIVITESGELLVNGTTQSGEILYPTYAREGSEYPYVVPEGSYFLLGDYRTTAKDSRDFGSIPRSALEGKVITILRRRGI